MSKKQVLVTLPVLDKHKEYFEEYRQDCNFHYLLNSEVTPEQISNFEIIVGNVPPSYLKASKHLKLLQLNSSGADAYTVPGLLSRHTILTNAAGAYGKAVAEHMLAMMMCLQKKIPLYRDDQFQGKWEDYGTVTSVADATVLVVGLGDIGLHFAGLVKALGGYVIGLKRNPAVCPPQVDEVKIVGALKAVVSRADVVASFLPNTPTTYHLYNKDIFEQMKPTGIFLNAGRGMAVVQEDLLAAIKKGQLYGAGLDVTDPEPLPPNHPLWKEPRILITPHISGQYHLPETLDRIVAIAAKNIGSYLKGEVLTNVIETGNM